MLRMHISGFAGALAAAAVPFTALAQAPAPAPAAPATAPARPAIQTTKVEGTEGAERVNNNETAGA